MKKTPELKANERIDDLQVGGLKIIQSTDEYCFTSDAVLLANFAGVSRNDTVADFGTGSGIIAILVAHKQKPKKIYGIEIQPQLADMAQRSVFMNGLDGAVEIVNCDIKDFPGFLNGAAIDAVICNPPYRKLNSGQAQEKENLKICRHEVKITLDEIVLSASKVLKHKGKFFIVHQAQRTAELFETFVKYGIEPKIIQIVCSREGDAPNLVLVCGVKGANKELKWLKPLTVFDQNGNFTKTIKEIYSQDGANSEITNN